MGGRIPEVIINGVLLRHFCLPAKDEMRRMMFLT